MHNYDIFCSKIYIIHMLVYRTYISEYLEGGNSRLEWHNNKIISQNILTCGIILYILLRHLLFFYSCIFIAIKYAFTDTTNFLKNPFRFHIKSNKKGIYFIMICEIKCSLHFSFLLQWILGGSS